MGELEVYGCECVSSMAGSVTFTNVFVFFWGGGGWGIQMTTRDDVICSQPLWVGEAWGIAVTWLAGFFWGRVLFVFF